MDKHNTMLVGVPMGLAEGIAAILYDHDGQGLVVQLEELMNKEGIRAQHSSLVRFAEDRLVECERRPLIQRHRSPAALKGCRSASTRACWAQGRVQRRDRHPGHQRRASAADGSTQGSLGLNQVGCGAIVCFLKSRTL